MNRWLAAALAFVLLALGTPRDGWACSCFAAGPPCQNFFEVDAVFTGTVQSISSPQDGDGRGMVRVEFEGVVGQREVQGPHLSITTHSQSTACGYRFTPGQPYVVYARRTATGDLEVSACSRTRPLTEAADDLRFFQRGTRSAGAFVSGTIVHWERDAQTGAPLEVGPLGDALVTVHGLAGLVDTRTDRRGGYRIAGLAPGRYEITVSPPPEFSTRYLNRAVELRDPRACAVSDFEVQYDGRIRGSLRTPSGAPAAGVRVDAVAIENAGADGNVFALHTQADADGRFEFSEVSPGRYLVAVHLIACSLLCASSPQR